MRRWVSTSATRRCITRPAHLARRHRDARQRRVGRAARCRFARLAGHDGRLRALPRPQVRSDHQQGLLRPGRRLCEHLARQAADRRDGPGRGRQAGLGLRARGARRRPARQPRRTRHDRRGAASLHRRAQGRDQRPEKEARDGRDPDDARRRRQRRLDRRHHADGDLDRLAARRGARSAGVHSRQRRQPGRDRTAPLPHRLCRGRAGAVRAGLGAFGAGGQDRRARPVRWPRVCG